MVVEPELGRRIGPQPGSLTGNRVGPRWALETNMRQVSYYDPAERQMEKERSRAFDAAALSSGVVSHRDLSARNGFFSSLQVVDSAVICQEVFA